MSLSLTYQHLPEWLLEPLMAEVVKAHEAAEIWDCLLLEPGEVTILPRHLFPAAERLALWEMEADPTQH